jgi:hypothetical protein
MGDLENEVAPFRPPIEEHLLKHRGTDGAEEQRLEATGMSSGSSFPPCFKGFSFLQCSLEVRDAVLLLPLDMEPLFT